MGGHREEAAGGCRDEGPAAGPGGEARGGCGRGGVEGRGGSRTTVASAIRRGEVTIPGSLWRLPLGGGSAMAPHPRRGWSSEMTGETPSAAPPAAAVTGHVSVVNRDLCEHAARNLISQKSATALVCVRNVLHSPDCGWTLPCSRCGPVSTVVDCAQLASPRPVPGPGTEPVIRLTPVVITSAVKRSIGFTTGFTITEKVPTTRAFSWLKAPTSAFTFKKLLRNYAKRALTLR